MTTNDRDDEHDRPGLIASPGGLENETFVRDYWTEARAAAKRALRLADYTPAWDAQRAADASDHDDEQRGGKP